MRRLHRGFTIVELQIASALFVAVGAVLTVTLVSASQFWRRSVATAELDGDGLVAMTALRATLRETSVVDVGTVGGWSTIHYLSGERFSPSEGRVNFNQERHIAVVQVKGQRHLVITDHTARTLRTLARNVTAFTVRTHTNNPNNPQLLKPGELDVTLSMAKPKLQQALMVNSRIWLRNREGMPLLREAEHAILEPPMQKGNDPRASDGEYIWVPEDFGDNYESPGGDPGFVRFPITVPQTDIYYLWAKVLAPDSQSNSFFVTSDGGLVEDPWHISRKSSWRWRLVTELSLSEGSHVIGFNRREDGTKLDRIFVTDDPESSPTF